jgi:hypothetical protein
VVRILQDFGRVSLFLVVLNAEQPRIGSVLQNLLRLMEEKFGRRFWRHVVLVFTRYYTDPRSSRRRGNKTREMMREDGMGGEGRRGKEGRRGGTFPSVSIQQHPAASSSIQQHPASPNGPNPGHSQCLACAQGVQLPFGGPVPALAGGALAPRRALPERLGCDL